MGRRHDSAYTDLLEVASRLPWKLGVGLALIAFILLHLIAAGSVPAQAIAHPVDLGPIIVRQYVHVFAFFLQFIIPAGLLTGAAVSFVKRSRSIALLDDVRRGPGRDISALTWQEFETLVGEGFRQRGFQVSERGGSVPDGAIDLILRRGNEKFLVQCKQWRAQQVGVTIIRELYGVMAAQSAAGGYVVTSGRFTKDAAQFAEGRNIELIDGDRLDALLRDQVAAASPAKVVPIKAATRVMAAPSCPRCQSPMVERIAKQGIFSGGVFWGCSQFPRCRSTIPKTA